MFDDLYRNERADSLSQMVQRPQMAPAEPGAFTGIGSAIADIFPSAANTTASAWTAILDAYGKASAYANAPTVAMVNNSPAPDMGQLEASTIGQMGNSEDARHFRERAKQYAPDPAAVGTAGQIVHGLGTSLAKAVGYSVTAGPAAPILFGADAGINRAQELSDAGVDDATAAKAGVVTGITSAAGLKLPPALGATRLQSAGIGAVINPVMGAAERGTIHSLLEHADYPAIAQQYKPFDPMQIAIEAATGAGFGAIFHSSGPKLTPEQHAATLVMNEVRTHDADTLTRPGDIAAAGIANDAQAQARAQIDSGEAVSVRVPVDPVQFEAAMSRVKDVARSQLDEVGRTDAATNEAYVSGIVEPFIRTLSKRLGINPEETFAKYGAKVVGDRQGSFYQNPDHFLADFNNVDTIKLEALKMSEAEIDHAEQLFLSAFPENTTTYRRTTGILKRIRRASDNAADELRGQPETARIHDGPLGPFSGYEIRGEVLPPDSFNPKGSLAVKVFGKEQVQAGHADEPALTFTVTPGGELTVNGPSPSGATFAAFKSKGWADRAKGAQGEDQAGWSALKTKDGKPMPISELVPMLADVHARVKEWRGEDHVGLHWSRATGALGGLFGDNPTAVFFQGGKHAQIETPEFKHWFGDSKVVDSGGNPLVVYHGTDKAFTKVNMKKGAQGVFWMTSDKAAIEAGEVGAAGKGKIMELYAKIEKPAGWAEYDKYSIDELISRGYDGIVLPEKDGTFSAVVFEPNQVKSATKNNGQFNPNDASILKQGGDAPRGAIDPTTNTISLFETADRSTFIHESGHHFLSIYGKIAGESDAPAVIREDMASILQWLGVKDLEAWNKLSLDEQRPAHEKFAEGFEQYIASGKAPKPELQGFFDQFASWMKEVYKSFSNLGTKFSPDVKEVMDRMFGKDLEAKAETAEAKAEAPELTAARAAVDRAPDMIVRMEDGRDVPASDALRDAEFELKQAQAKAEAFKADAINADPNTLYQGRNSAQQELNAAMASLSRSMPEWPEMSRADRIAAAADVVAQNMVAVAEKKQQRIALTVVSHDRLMNRYSSLVGDEIKPFHAIGKMLENVSAYSRGVGNEYFSRLIDTMNAVDSKFLGMIENSKQAGELVREIFGEDTGNKVAKAGAKAWLETVESMRQRFNRAGGDIAKLDYGYLPQPHDAVRVLRAGAEKWSSDILPLLDRSRYVDAKGAQLNDAAMMDMLGNVWKTITEEGRNKMEPGTRQGTGMRANKGTDHRAIHFKDADSYIQYAAGYNKGGIMSAMQGHVSRLAKDIGLVEEMGPNPEVQFQFLHDTAEKSGATDLIGPWLVTTNNMWSALNGSLGHPVNVKMAEVMQGARNVEIFGKLQSALLSSVTDLPTYFITTGFNRLPILDSTINLVRSFGGDTKDYANRAGLIAESVVSDMNRWAEGNIGAGVTGKLANATMKASLLEAWTDSLRRGFSITMMGALGKMSRSEWSALDAGDRLRLEAKGVTETDFKIWQMATPENWRGSQMLTAPAVRAIPESTLAASGLTVRDLDRSVSKLLGAIVDESEYASLAQNLETRAAVTRGTKKGTVEGEFLRSIMLFKGFPMAMISRHWGRVADQWSHGEHASALRYSAGLITSLTVFGALAIQLKDMANGKDPRDMTTLKFWGAAFAQGGGAGIFGDILYTGMGGQNRAGVPNWMSMAGPVVGSGLEFVDLTAGNIGEAMKGKETHAGAEALRFGRSHLPFVNMWYAKSAIDHAGLHDLQELLSPGYLSRMQDRAHQDWNQSFYWQPGRGLPNRAPDLSKAGG